MVMCSRCSCRSAARSAHGQGLRSARRAAPRSCGWSLRSASAADRPAPGRSSAARNARAAGSPSPVPARRSSTTRGPGRSSASGKSAAVVGSASRRPVSSRKSSRSRRPRRSRTSRAIRSAPGGGEISLRADSRSPSRVSGDALCASYCSACGHSLGSAGSRLRSAVETCGEPWRRRGLRRASSASWTTSTRRARPRMPARPHSGGWAPVASRWLPWQGQSVRLRAESSFCPDLEKERPCGFRSKRTTVTSRSP